MMKYILVIVIFFIYSCKTEKKKVNSVPVINDTVDMKTDISNQNFQQNNVDYSLLNGVWGENKNENALFYIDKDSIYYIDHQDNPYYIEKRDDSLLIHIDDLIYRMKIKKLDTDSLILKSMTDTIRLYRVVE